MLLSVMVRYDGKIMHKDRRLGRTLRMSMVGDEGNSNVDVFETGHGKI